MPASDPTHIVPPATCLRTEPKQLGTVQEAPQGATFAPLVPRQRGRAAPAPAGGQGAQGAPLGLRTPEVSTPPDNIPSQKGKGILRRYQLQEAAAELLPQHRVRWCGCRQTAEHVGVLYHAEHKSASYRGLAVCGSAWVCPLCGTKIAARRAEELAAGIASWQKRGFFVYMVTFTLRHQKGHRLRFLWEGMNKSHQLLHRAGTWGRIKKRYDLAGTVTGREVNYGSNGWHPHLHSLLFTRKRMSSDEQFILQGKLFHNWAIQLKKFGLDATKERGVHIREANEEAADYFTKNSQGWSAAKEVAFTPGKTAKEDSKTPQQLLMMYARGDAKAGDLYKEYAEATRRSSTIHWSKGLKEEVLGTKEDKSDQEIAEEHKEEAEEILVLTDEQWSKIVRYRLRGDLLADICEQNYDKTVVWLASCGIVLASWQLKYTNKGKLEV